MPELPEAETIARALNRALKKKKITKVEVFTERLRSPLKPLTEAKLVGRTFTGCRRRARYAIADLDDGRAVMLHFGMTGVARVEDRKVPRRKHEHVVISLSGGDALKFEDPRRFGMVEAVEMGKDGWPEALKDIGVEPLSEAFTGEVLFQASRGRKKPVKELLMDNAVVTGIGNIYAAETLYACGIRPQKKSSTLTREQCDRLAKEAKRILKLSIKWGGTTVSDFRHVDGTEGKFTQHLKIYGMKECPRCGSAVKTIVLGGRNSWYCPKCQK